MTQALREIDEFISLVEAVIPANPSSRKAQDLEKQTAEIMAGYFRRLEQAFPYSQLDAIYNRHVKVTEAGPVGETRDILDPILKTFRAKLTTDLIGQHVKAYLLGSAEMITWGTTKGGIPIAYEGPPIQQAISYAKEHCAKMVTNMDEESKSLIARIVGEGIENKRGIDGLARDLRAGFEDMSKARSRIIARTETCDALEQAFMDRSNAMGITGKEWIVIDPCPICEANERDGVVGIDYVYDNGGDPVTRPPQHPACMCALAPVMLPTEIGEE